MNEQILIDAGLTKPQARTYKKLVENGPTAPPALAKLINESRTNTYKLLESLEEIGLVSRDETHKKLRYWANNPTVLADNWKRRVQEVKSAEKRIQGSMPELIDNYMRHSEQPGVRYFYGKEGIEQVYNDQLADKQPISFIMSIGVRNHFGIQAMHEIRNRFPKLGIKRKVFYPDVAQSLLPNEERVTVEESDRLMLLERIWLEPEDLVEPVEWSVYGNKVSVISLGQEMLGMVIESKQIADSFREILDLLEKKIVQEPGYDKLPRHHTFTKKPEVKT